MKYAAVAMWGLCFLVTVILLHNLITKEPFYLNVKGITIAVGTGAVALIATKIAS
jgi:hypothetical protein